MSANYAGHRDQHFGCTSYSQHGEDLMLLNIFNLITPGLKPTYLDLGAHHPVNISNTKLLYDRGSRGVNVEANPNLFPAFVNQRPEDVNVHAGVVAGTEDTRGSGCLYMYDGTSGRNTMSVDEVKSMEPYNLKVTEKMIVPTLTLSAIKYQYCPNSVYPDLLSVDIEGLDYDVLTTADFSVSFPKVIIVETRVEQGGRMISMLFKKGYALYCRMGENLILIQRNFHHKAY